MHSLQASLSAPAWLKLKKGLLNLRVGSARRDGLNQGAGRSSSHGLCEETGWLPGLHPCTHSPAASRQHQWGQLWVLAFYSQATSCHFSSHCSFPYKNLCSTLLSLSLMHPSEEHYIYTFCSSPLQMPLCFVPFHLASAALADLIFHRQPGYHLRWRLCCCICSFICISQRW